MSSLSFTLIQTQLHWEDKAANLAMLEKKIMGIPERTEVVVLPEMFSTGFSMQPQKFAEGMDGETVLWMKRVRSPRPVRAPDLRGPVAQLRRRSTLTHRGGARSVGTTKG